MYIFIIKYILNNWYIVYFIDIEILNEYLIYILWKIFHKIISIQVKL